jgi:hypothetical protein
MRVKRTNYSKKLFQDLRKKFRFLLGFQMHLCVNDVYLGSAD